jgi:hypothetical protein
MASEAQITANRRNAAKSTGPKSERGTAAAAQNSLRHGLRADKLTCFDEEAADFAAFHDGHVAAFAPADEAEAQLVERIALCAWRLRRSARVEADMFNAFRRPNPPMRNTEIASVFDLAAPRMILFSRYEVALDRALQRAQLMLERRQAQRRGEIVPAPIAIDVNGLEMIETLDPARSLQPENFQTKGNIILDKPSPKP